MMKNEQEESICELFEQGELTLYQIADELECSYKKVWSTVAKHYDMQQRKEHQSKKLSQSKMGEKNPMSGKTGNKHHNFKERIADGNGYMMVLKPEWYEGRKGSKHVFEHTIVMCEHLGLTKLPRGMVIHHLDKDRSNNDIHNLALMTSAAHARLHQLERATTSRKT